MTRTEALPLLLSEVETVCGVFGGDKSVDALRAAFSAYLDALPDPAERGEWRPISEYPQDAEGWGPNALLFVPTGQIAPASDYRILTGRLEAEMWLAWDDTGAMFDIEGVPTKWQPLPTAPPARTGEGGDGERP